MVNQSAWIGIAVGVFFAGLGIGYAAFSATSQTPVGMQQWHDMMQDPNQRQQMMNQMMQNPEMMTDWMNKMMGDPQAMQHMHQMMLDDPQHMQQMQHMMGNMTGTMMHGKK